MDILPKTNNTVNVFMTNQALIHIKHNISIVQYKYWHLMLKFFSDVLEKKIEFDESDGFCYVYRSEFDKYIGYEATTENLKKDIEELRRKPIIVNYLEKDGTQTTHGMGFISEYKITSNLIAFKLPSFIEELIRFSDESRKMFLLLNWTVFNSFAGKYEAIIYKLCKDYAGVGRTPYLTIDEYRNYLGLEKNEYKVTDSLTRRCIKEPIKRINENKLSDISVSVNYKRSGRKIEGLYFSVKQTKNKALPLENFKASDAFDNAIISISVKDQLQYLDQFTETQIIASIDQANAYMDNLRLKGCEVSASAIYHKSISENWGQQKLEQKDFEKAKKDEEVRNKQKKLAEQKQKETKKKQQQEKEKKQTQDLLDIFESYDDATKEEIIRSAINTVKSAHMIYRKLLQSYEEFGVDAYKHNAILKGQLVEVLSLTNNHIQRVNDH